MNNKAIDRGIEYLERMGKWTIDKAGKYQALHGLLIAMKEPEDKCKFVCETCKQPTKITFYTPEPDPIREVYEKWKDKITVSKFPADDDGIADMWNAIKKYVGEE